MRIVLVVLAALPAVFAAVASADTKSKFEDCPLLGPIEDYSAQGKPQWENWDEETFKVSDGDGEKEIQVDGAVCTQDYPEDEGKTEGSILEITENYKEALQQLGAELKIARPGYVTAHLTKDGQEYWFRISASRDDGYRVAEVLVQPFKPSLLSPSGNDFRLIGHMPTAVAGTPTKKHFDQFDFPTDGGSVSIQGAMYDVNYDWPTEKQPSREITTKEVIENYRGALKDLNAQILRDNPENLSARLDDHGQTVYVFIQQTRVVAVDEKPFKMTYQPPSVDEMKDKLDKEGHISLYVNFDFDKASLKPDSAPVVSQVVELLKRNPDLKVSIEGHTDNIGTHDYNVKLSQDRAASVVSAIVAGGIDGGRLQSAGFGPDKPIAPNDTDEGRAKNRRVELVKAS